MHGIWQEPTIFSVSLLENIAPIQPDRKYQHHEVKSIDVSPEVVPAGVSICPLHVPCFPIPWMYNKIPYLAVSVC